MVRWRNPVLRACLWSLATLQVALWSVFSKMHSTSPIRHEARDESLCHGVRRVKQVFFKQRSLPWSG